VRLGSDVHGLRFACGCVAEIPCGILDVFIGTQRGARDVKTTKKKSIGKALAAALKAMENMNFETADLDVQLNQVREMLNAAGVHADFGSIAAAGRTSPGVRLGTGQHRFEWICLGLAGMGLRCRRGCTALQ
jgi:hypothetical protein